jgi:hypothetical protein
MRKLPLILTLLCALVTTASLADESKPAADESLVAFAQQRTNAVRITKNPVKMADRVVLLCASFPHEQQIADIQKAAGAALENPHREKYAHVFVSPQGAPAMRTNSGVFPLGTIILKEKFSDPAGRVTELFTGMLKRETGFNPGCGDWEFFTLSADAKNVTSRGKLQSCMECHVEYKDSDFVTKHYAYFPF